MKVYAETLRDANLTIALIERDQRQERRLQKSNRRLIRRRVRRWC